MKKLQKFSHNKKLQYDKLIIKSLCCNLVIINNVFFHISSTMFIFVRLMIFNQTFFFTLFPIDFLFCSKLNIFSMLCGKILFSYRIRFLLFVISIMKTTASRNASGGCRAFDRQTRGNWKSPNWKNILFGYVFAYFFMDWWDCSIFYKFSLAKIIYTIITIINLIIEMLEKKGSK